MLSLKGVSCERVRGVDQGHRLMAREESTSDVGGRPELGRLGSRCGSRLGGASRPKSCYEGKPPFSDYAAFSRAIRMWS